MFWCTKDTEISILVGHDDEIWDFGATVPIFVIDEIQAAFEKMPKKADQVSSADGVKIAVLRKSRAELTLIWAAAHRRR